MASIFSKIISGDIPCYKIAEDDNFFAFLDINPVAIGHTLIVPKKEVDYLFDLEPDTLSLMLPFCKRVSKAIEAVISCERIGVTVIGLEVPHAHIHLIPINELNDMDFSRAKKELSQEEFSKISSEIASNFS